MKKIIKAVSKVAVAAGIGAGGMYAVKDDKQVVSPEPGTTRYIVRAKKNQKLRIGASFKTKVGKRFVGQMRKHDGFIAYLTDKEAKEAQLDANVERDVVYKAISSCSPKLPIPGPNPDRPEQVVPWGILASNSDQAHKQGVLGDGIVVCIVDTGGDVEHPDLVGQYVGCDGFTNGEGYCADGNGHGTHVGGTVAALNNDTGVVGVAPNAKLIAMKVLTDFGYGFSSAIAEGIRACVDQGANVINLSLGGPDESSVTKEAVDYALSKGVVVVAAAGNESSSAPSYPAQYPGVIAVSAINEVNELADFSNFGSIDFTAPGVDVLSSTPGGFYESFSGTSMASPHVAGVAALMLSQGKYILKAQDIGLPFDQQGQGLIDAKASVE